MGESGSSMGGVYLAQSGVIRFAALRHRLNAL
jgi:hypothetical protein